jgi:hypothetical protein
MCEGVGWERFLLLGGQFDIFLLMMTEFFFIVILGLRDIREWENLRTQNINITTCKTHKSIPVIIVRFLLECKRKFVENLCVKAKIFAIKKRINDQRD